MKTAQYTMQQLERWEDVHAIENLMGRRAFHILLRQDTSVWKEHWCRKAAGPCIGVNDGYYKGYEAVEGWFAATERLTALKAALARKKYPEELGGKTDDEVFGAGTLHLNSLTTPVIEIAEDQATAKGLWYFMDQCVDYTVFGRTAQQTWGRLGADFVREDGAWKLWHMVLAVDLSTQTGTDWTKPAQARAADPLFAPLGEFRFPAPNFPQSLFASYCETRPIEVFPAIPVPYRTFAETFNYGV